jgi:hypothetical protein
MRGKPLTAAALLAGSALMMWSSGAFAQGTLNVGACAPVARIPGAALAYFPATSGVAILGGTVVGGFTLSGTETVGNFYTSGNGHIA